VASGALARPTTSALAAPMGRPREWARDFSFIGGMTGLLAPWLLGDPTYIAAAAVTGAIAGAGLGAAVPGLLNRMRHFKVPTLLLGGVAIGATWGGIAGAVAGLTTPHLFWLSISVASIAGAIQFGWIWLPYVLKKIGHKRTWPLVLASFFAAPVLGWASIWLFVMIAALFGINI
jgi:hypothetical protein